MAASSLSRWLPSSITPALLDQVRSVRDEQRLTMYQIVEGRLYRNNSHYAGLADTWKGCYIQPRCHGVEYFLQAVLSRAATSIGTTPTAPHGFPDVEFFVNVRDTPAALAHRQARGGTAAGPPLLPPLPVFSFSVPTDGRFADIMYPSWAFHHGGPWLKELSASENNKIWDWDVTHQELAAAASAWPWDAKRDVLFFRGSRTTDTRDALVDVGQHGNPLIDIQYTKGTSQRADAKRTTQAFPQVHLRDHCAYR
jgi:hypothetical protein